MVDFNGGSRGETQERKAAKIWIICTSVSRRNTDDCASGSGKGWIDVEADGAVDGT